MAPKGEACAECTQNCLLMHKKEKNPSPVATSFVKVMFGDEYSKVLFLPPKFAHTVQKKSGRSTWLEDSNGEKWKVRFTKIDGLLAFEEGWNTFCLAHGLKVGDLLVFHYIMESYFVVSMYGESGCPENRHFGFTPNPMKETRKEHKLTTVDHHIPSNATTNGNHHHLEIKDSVGSQQKEISIKKKRTDDMMSPNTHDHLVASSSQSQPSDSDKEKSQRSKPLVNTNPDNTNCETPTIVKNNHSAPVQDSEDEHLGVNSLQKHDVSILQTSPKKSSGGRKDDVAAGGGGDGTKVKESGKLLETLSKKMTEKPKENTFKPSIKKRLRSTMFPMTPTKIVKKDSVLTSQTDVSGSKSRNDDGAPASSPKPIVSPPKIIKKEPISAREEHDSRFHNVGVPHKPIAKPMEMPNKSPPTLKRDSTGVMKTSSSGKTDFNNSHKEESNNFLQKVKPEPVDYEDTPWTGPTNTSFSAVMSSYQYLEIPKWVKLKSKVILLRNKADLWPVLYQNKVGLKALTQSWEAFARQRGIQIGDNCEFVLESEANSNFTCSVFTVHVTSK
ncbi:uncharacterized protein LOC111921507 [Lactuca sativa]|uniref:TF-B3 domain-containing protein n=1 Tax=Lactuca sativa TaxID=4236 RepID=A0A9R1VTY6_LACSA|nr:uncharacterized protein LOC111921507 [Lactuca sativa]KAJ0210533.1 hypothetical protein LSAT_V11C400188350 [Lactuca sativa]